MFSFQRANKKSIMNLTLIGSDMQLERMDPPGPNWVYQLEKGDWIYLVKEQVFKRVAEPFTPSDASWAHNNQTGTTGTIGLEEDNNIYPDGSHIVSGSGKMSLWYMRPDGTGFDKKLLIEPVKGHLRDNISAERIADLEARLKNVMCQATNLRRILDTLLDIKEKQLKTRKLDI